MSQPPTVPPFVNRTMKFILRSPMHGMVSHFTTLLSFTGRKSGKTFTTPVSYSQFDDQVYIFTHANWWKNLRSGTPVTLRLRGQEIAGVVEAVSQDQPTIATGLAAHLRKVPSDAKYYGVTFDETNSDSHLALIDGPYTVALSTILPNGQPQTTPVWCNRKGDYLFINVMKGFRKEKNMRLNPKVPILAYDPKNRLHNIEIRGLVVEMTEEGAVEHDDELACAPAVGRSQRGVAFVAHFDPERCAACPFADKCPPSPSKTTHALGCVGSFRHL